MGKAYMQKLSELIEKELDQLSTKGTLSPTELDSAKKAMELLKCMEEYSMLCEEKNSADGMYSGRMRMGSYGGSYNGVHEVYDPMCNGGSYGHYSMNDSSYGRGNWNANVNGQYSSHSVRDRMIDRLERMMDEAKSEYERQEIMNEINRIRKEN